MNPFINDIVHDRIKTISQPTVAIQNSAEFCLHANCHRMDVCVSTVIAREGVAGCLQQIVRNRCNASGLHVLVPSSTLNGLNRGDDGGCANRRCKDDVPDLQFLVCVK